MPAADLILESKESDNIIRRISDYERISAIIWLVFGILQICLLITIIAGIWNIFAGLSRLKIIPAIQARNKNIPAAYEGLTGYIVIALINLIFGGFIGLFFVAFDLYIRDLVLSHRNIFNSEDSEIVQTSSQTPVPPSFRRPTPQPRQPAPTMESIETIERLSRMKDEGILTETEFKEAKARILN